MFNIYRIYQTHPDVNLIGKRSTIVRYKAYGLEKYLRKDSEVLDVGANVCLFSIYVSDKVKSVDSVEYDAVKTKIGNIAKRMMKVDNVSIYNEDIKKFKSDKKYDVVFSFAIHMWVGCSLDEYIKILSNFLKPNGVILIESHSLRSSGDKLDTFLKENYKKYKVLESGLTDDDDGHLRRFYYIKPEVH